MTARKLLPSVYENKTKVIAFSELIIMLAHVDNREAFKYSSVYLSTLLVVGGVVVVSNPQPL